MLVATSDSFMQEQVIARVDLPGASNADVSLQVHQTRLLISAGPEGAAQLLKHLEGDGHVVYRRDRGTGGFFRSVLLPGGIRVDDIKATMRRRRAGRDGAWKGPAMPDFSRILCAIDLTDPSRRALDCALWWARRHGADVSVLHVRRADASGADAVGDRLRRGRPRRLRARGRAAAHTRRTGGAAAPARSVRRRPPNGRAAGRGAARRGHERRRRDRGACRRARRRSHRDGRGHRPASPTIPSSAVLRAKCCAPRRARCWSCRRRRPTWRTHGSAG